MAQQNLHQIIDEMRQAHIQEGFPLAGLRIDRLERAKKLLLENKDQLLDYQLSYFEDLQTRYRSILLFEIKKSEPHLWQYDTSRKKVYFLL